MVLSLYIESSSRSIILLPALQITEAKEADAFFPIFLFFTTCAIPTPPRRPGDVNGEESDFWSNKLAFNPHFLHF